MPPPHPYIRPITELKKQLIARIHTGLTINKDDKIFNLSESKNTQRNFMAFIDKSHKLDNVCYDIRGPALKQAKQLEEEGHRILKLHVGNPQPFGFDAPEEIIQDMIRNLPASTGYADSKGLFSARKAVMQYYQQQNIKNIDIEDIYLGNGVSELIVMATQSLLNDKDEVLIPAPDYPLWTAAVSLAGGQPVHYHCDEQAEWFPCLKDISSKITKRTKAIVIINPNNPTGALYSPELLQNLLELARKHKLLVFSDEIYDKVIYDQAIHTPTASLADDLTFVTFSGLSKSYRCAGLRSGWLVISGDKRRAQGFIEGLDILSTMRLCANVPAQYVIQTALGGYQSIQDLVQPTGRLGLQRDLAHDLLTTIPGISCVKPKAAMYLFPKLDPQYYPIQNDEKFILDLLLDQKILVVQGSAFNINTHDHFRIVFLPHNDQLKAAIQGLEVFLNKLRKNKKSYIRSINTCYKDKI